MTNLATRLNSLRKHFRITQAELGSRLGLSGRFIGDLERGTRKGKGDLFWHAVEEHKPHWLLYLQGHTKTLPLENYDPVEFDRQFGIETSKPRPVDYLQQLQSTPDYPRRAGLAFQIIRENLGLSQRQMAMVLDIEDAKQIELIEKGIKSLAPVEIVELISPLEIGIDTFIFAITHEVADIDIDARNHIYSLMDYEPLESIGMNEVVSVFEKVKKQIISKPDGARLIFNRREEALIRALRVIGEDYAKDLFYTIMMRARNAAKDKKLKKEDLDELNESLKILGEAAIE